MVKNYSPKQGDIIWVNFTNTKGHEQQGKRPALIISDSRYNKKVGLALAAPITSNQKGYPFEVELKKEKTNGVVLSDQVKSLDYKKRKVKFKEQASPQVLLKVIEKVKLLIEP